MPSSQANIHLYNCADVAMQNAIIASMSQDEDESIQNYLVCLRAIAIDSNFTCLSCQHDLSDIYIKDQIIQRIANNTLQADLLAKARMLKSLKQNVPHAEAFESAL